MRRAANQYRMVDTTATTKTTGVARTTERCWPAALATAFTVSRSVQLYVLLLGRGLKCEVSVLGRYTMLLDTVVEAPSELSVFAPKPRLYWS